MEPLASTAQLRLNMKPERDNFTIPKIVADVVFEEIVIAFGKHQVCSFGKHQVCCFGKHQVCCFGKHQVCCFFSICWINLLFLYSTSCKYSSSGRTIVSALRASILSALVGLCPAEVMSFISIHHVAPATTLLLLLLLPRMFYCCSPGVADMNFLSRILS